MPENIYTILEQEKDTFSLCEIRPDGSLQPRSVPPTRPQAEEALRSIQGSLSIPPSSTTQPNRIWEILDSMDTTELETTACPHLRK